MDSSLRLVLCAERSKKLIHAKPAYRRQAAKTQRKKSRKVGKPLRVLDPTLRLCAFARDIKKNFFAAPDEKSKSRKAGKPLRVLDLSLRHVRRGGRKEKNCLP